MPQSAEWRTNTNFMCVKLANPNSNGQMLAKRRYNKAGGCNIIEGERGQNYASIFAYIPSSKIFMTHPPIAIHKIHIKMCVLVANHCELKTFLSLSILLATGSQWSVKAI